MSDIPKADPLSLVGTFADAVLACKAHLAAAELIEDEFSPTLIVAKWAQAQKDIEMHVRMSEGWSALAAALQHGAPGQRF